jgi:hypothetical protein
MKLRIKGNSVRLRLTQSEVATFKATGRVEDNVSFGTEPGHRLVYALESSRDQKSIGVVYEDNSITVLVPDRTATDWVETDQVGIDGEQPLGHGETVNLLVEKDFACLAPRAGEEEKDAYPHPMEGVSC